MGTIIQIAWGEMPGDDAEVIPKADALNRVEAATEVRAYEPQWEPWDLAVAFGMARHEDTRLKWYQFSSPKGEVICVSQDCETYWVQRGLSL
ncbi:MAG TPA: hypothetical protein VJ841_05055 [Candidatus Saccharimonadales bacterium]|nr:hypothetical protein [Candidatus Saccharimonadales bacterium]